MPTGDIGAVLDSLEFDPANGQYTSIVRVSNTVYAIAYNGPDNDGWLATVTINPDGSIDNSVIDTMEFDTDFFWNGKIIHAKGNVFCIAYRGPTNHGWLKTVTINPDGSIDDSVIDSLEFDAVTCDYPDIVHVTGDKYAIAYSGGTGYGVLKTVTISDNGMLGDTVIDELIFRAGAVGGCRIVQVGTGTIFAIAYNYDEDVWVCTAKINADGTIDNAVIDELAVETNTSSWPALVAVTKNTYGIAYRGPLNDGWLKTITINDNGMIDDTVIDSLEFDDADCQEPEIISIGDNVFAIVYIAGAYTGMTRTVRINDNGMIDDTVIDSLEFESVQCFCPDPVHCAGDIYAIAYRGPDIDGWLKSIGIETPPPGGVQYLPLMGIG